MRFSYIAEQFEKVEKTSSRLEMIDIIASTLQTLSGEEGAIFSYLLTGRVAPDFVDNEFNISDITLVSTLQLFADNRKLKINVEKLRSTLGDIGEVAKTALEKVESGCHNGVQERGHAKEDSNIQEMYIKLWDLVNTSGQGAQSLRQSKIIEIFKDCSPLEAKFISRILTGKLRLGASVKSVIEALNVVYGEKGDKALRKYYAYLPDIGEFVWALKVGSLDQLVEELPLTGIPIKPRLVERVADFNEAIERMGQKFAMQPKFDGLRCLAHILDENRQDHKESRFNAWIKFRTMQAENVKGTETMSMFEQQPAQTPNTHHVRLFSRNLEEISEMFPEITSSLLNGAKDTIIDGELIGVNPDGSFARFQDTMTRKRKYDISGAAAKTPVKYFVFDILKYNGKVLIDTDFEDRQEILKQYIAQLNSENIVQTENIVSSGIESLKSYFNLQAEGGLEGIVIKELKGGYEAGERNFSWIKLKKSIEKSLVDTIDVVIMGYYYGSGKRTELGAGALLAGVYDPETEKFYSVTKIGTGITDEQWGIIKARLETLETAEMPANYDVKPVLHPDVWVKPEVVCTVEADEITVSKTHSAGVSIGGKGLALRFPRLKDFDRDKSSTDATSVKELVQFYEMK